MKKEDALVGTVVRCVSPDDFVSEVARKLRNRTGTIERFQMYSGRPIIEFPQIGRRKAFKWVPPDWSYIEEVK